MYNVFVVGFEPDGPYIEANCNFNNKFEAEAFARRYTDDYDVTISWEEN